MHDHQIPPEQLTHHTRFVCLSLMRCSREINKRVHRASLISAIHISGFITNHGLLLCEGHRATLASSESFETVPARLQHIDLWKVLSGESSQTPNADGCGLIIQLLSTFRIIFLNCASHCRQVSRSSCV
jgi:hypothetical protein